MHFSLQLLAVLAMISCVSAAKILAVLPMFGRSHFIYCDSVLSALAARGHQVTVYAPFAQKPKANMKYVEIHLPHEIKHKEQWTFEAFMEVVVRSSYWGVGVLPIWFLNYPICEETFNHPKIKELISSKEKFDVVAIEAFFGQECMTVFGHLFNAPVINLNGFGTYSIMNRVQGNDLKIASHPDEISFPFTNPMGFIDRFRNMVSTIAQIYIFYNMHLPKHQEIIERALPGRKIPPVADMVANISLSLINNQPYVGYVQPLPPNIVPVGGIHIANEPDPLSKEVKEFLDSGKNSVIYFSLGTVVPAHMMPASLLQLFVKVFSQLPYKILWKIELDKIDNLPSNVMLTKWISQQAVLAHPNCILFITHGGLLSQLEAFHAGKPVVGIPFFGDQPYNVEMYKETGTGVGVDILGITEQSFKQAILSVAGKPQYIENAKKVSRVFRHRAMAPDDTAAFWVEYVIMHNGAHHLRPHAASLPLYKLTLLDIFVVLGSAVVLFLALLWSVVKCLCCRKKQPVTSTKKKN